MFDKRFGRRFFYFPLLDCFQTIKVQAEKCKVVPNFNGFAIFKRGPELETVSKSARRAFYLDTFVYI